MVLDGSFGGTSTGESSIPYLLGGGEWEEEEKEAEEHRRGRTHCGIRI